MLISAPAKVNISLDVPGKRDDGYHDILTVMACVDLCDELRLEPSAGGISVRCDLPYLPRDGRNHAVKAAAAFFEYTGIKNDGLHITVKKRIPVCAGLGGGSADAAAVIRALNELHSAGLGVEEMEKIGLRVGTDVPFCVRGGVALAEGLGERLTPLPPLPPCHIVVCKPRANHQTAAFYARLDAARVSHRPDTAGIVTALERGSLREVCRRMYNVFTGVLDKGSPCVELERELIRAGALGAVMSGTGSAVFGVFENPRSARSAAARLSPLCQTFVCRPTPGDGE